ncbi:hypothetical protein ATI61_116154 [Archangium gephyra]|nr:hypothetical protein [Archangium gephyra]REG23682.1 hypothetical protein ATI61_116154 [Archangium gephyra]
MMNPSHPRRVPFLSVLCFLVLLTALPARADLPHEVIFVSRAEISDEALRNVIGIASISAMTGPDQQPTGEVPSFRPEGEAFASDSKLILKELGPLSGWDYDRQSLMKFPVVEQRGQYLHVVVDVRTNKRAWLREGEEADKGPSVGFFSFDSQKWRWSGVELYHLAPRGQSRLYLAPRLDARSHPVSRDYPLRRNGELVDARILQRQGNFLQIGAMIDLDKPLEPLGWLPISDENGLLLIWPVYAPMC